MCSLTKLDWEIIELLNMDGRMPAAEIARRVGIPARTVSHRIDTLIECGIFSIKAIVNPAALGFPIMADVFIDVEPGHVRSVAKAAADFPEVTYVALATGGCDVSISLRVRNNDELFDFVTDKLGTIPGVHRTQTHLLPVKLKDIDSWLPRFTFGGDNGSTEPE
jgi:Lrp/AsnC family transcriptional regulator for asnA, asnC and gidA